MLMKDPDVCSFLQNSQKHTKSRDLFTPSRMLTVLNVSINIVKFSIKNGKNAVSGDTESASGSIVTCGTKSEWRSAGCMLCGFPSAKESRSQPTHARMIKFVGTIILFYCKTRTSQFKTRYGGLLPKTNRH